MDLMRFTRAMKIGPPRAAVLVLAAMALLARRPFPAAAEVTISRAALVTITDTTAVLTWETDRPADTVVRCGTRSGRLDQVVSSDRPVRFHYAELRGLQPGTRYYYLCQSGSARASTSDLSPGRFTTLAPPPGRELFSFATMTDTHVGERQVARLVLSPGKVVSQGVRWPDPNVPFWQLAVGSSIEEINDRPVAFTIIKGDITHGNDASEFPLAKRLLDRLKRPYRIVRGNHDRLGPLLRTFELPRPYYSFDHEGVHFVVLDTEPLAVESAGAALETQLAWLAGDLREHLQQWTFVFVHRPIPPRLSRGYGPLSDRIFKAQRDLAMKLYGPKAARLLTAVSGRTPCVHVPHARRLTGMLRNHGRIAGVFAGHLHRNYLGRWPEQTGNLPYVETAATKEYPCGYAVTRVFTGGYMQSFYTPRDPHCLEWSAMSADAYAGIGWPDKAGPLSDRNFVVCYRDLRGEQSGLAASGRTR